MSAYVPSEAEVSAGAEGLLGSDAITPNTNETPTHYVVEADNVEYLVKTVLVAAHTVAPTERCGAVPPNVSGPVPCALDGEHDEHLSTSGCEGSEIHWTTVTPTPREDVAEQVGRALEAMIELRKDYLPGLTGGDMPHVDLIGHEINTVEWVLRMLRGGDPRGWAHSSRWADLPRLDVLATPTPPADMVPAAALADAWDKGVAAAHQSRLTLFAIKQVNPYRAARTDNRGDDMSTQRITRKVTQRRGESPADCCRRMGWTVGTEITGDEGYGPTTIRITAIGERGILARRANDPGGHEGSWTLDCRDWVVEDATITEASA